MKLRLISALLAGLFVVVSQGCEDDDDDVCPACDVCATGGAAQGGTGGAGGSVGGAGGVGGAPAEIPFEIAEIKIEINDTDQDSGLQIFIDAEGWEEVNVFDPSDNLVFHVAGGGGVQATGLTELYFESAEPGYEVLPLDQFLARFPEGSYRFEGRTTEGEKLVGAATLTHALPDAPVLVSPAENSIQDPNNTVIQWQAVADPPNSQIVGYEVVLTHEDPPPERELVAKLPATATSLTVPPEFMVAGASYKYEVLAIEASGNQTLAEVPFQAAP